MERMVQGTMLCGPTEEDEKEKTDKVKEEEKGKEEVITVWDSRHQMTQVESGVLVKPISTSTPLFSVMCTA